MSRYRYDCDCDDDDGWQELVTDCGNVIALIFLGLLTWFSVVRGLAALGRML